MKLVKIVALSVACAIVGINAEWPPKDFLVGAGLLKTVAQGDKRLGLNLRAGDTFAFKVMQQGDSDEKMIPWVIKFYDTDYLELVDVTPDVPSTSRKFAPSTGFVFRAKNAGDTSVVIKQDTTTKSANQRTLTIKIK